VISLGRLALVHTRSWAADSSSSRLRLKSELDETQSEIALLREEIRIKDARMRLVDPHRRPRYPPTERLSILELRAARAWSAAQTARTFMLEPATIAEWMGRVDEGGDSALVRTAEPVNRFPDFVRHMVRRLKTLSPSMGKKRLAQTLARAGIHLAVTTVGRILKEKQRTYRPTPAEEPPAKRQVLHTPVVAKYPNHVWQVDLTVVPTTAGFWTAWLPFSLPQVWPFAWILAFVVDQYTRRILSFTVFRKEPTSRQIREFLGRVTATVGASPKYILSDKGSQFTCGAFKDWCRRRGIRPRYASTSDEGPRATAVIERYFKSLKDEWLSRTAVPFRADTMRQHVAAYVEWFHEYRPHQGLGGRTPDEVLGGGKPANERARIEPRARWPAESPCAGPWAKPSTKRFCSLTLAVRFHRGHRQLPVVEVKRVA
jgi:putative transposase